MFPQVILSRFKLGLSYKELLHDNLKPNLKYRKPVLCAYILCDVELTFMPQSCACLKTISSNTLLLYCNCLGYVIHQVQSSVTGLMVQLPW